MNVCLVSLVTVWHGVKGGMEIHGQLLAEGLAGLGHEVTILSSRHPSGGEVAVTGAVNRYALAGTRFGSQREGWASALSRVFGELHMRRPFDVVCCQQAVLPGEFLRLCRQAGVPIVALLEGHEGWMLLSELRQTLSHGRGYGRLPRRALAFVYHYLMWELPLLKACDRVIAVSDEIARSISRWFGVGRARIDVVYNGVDTEAFKPAPAVGASARRRLGLNGDGGVLLFLSSVTKQKGLHVLLRALPRVLASRPTVRLVVAGAGDYLDEARRFVEAHGLSPAVVFAGAIAHERTPEYLAACDAFVLPTLRLEGLPFAVLEAMACGKPVIVSRIGGVPSAVRDGENGLLVRPGDHEDLARAVERLLGDPTLAARLARSARETVERSYSVGQMVRGTADVLERAVRERARTLART